MPKQNVLLIFLNEKEKEKEGRRGKRGEGGGEGKKKRGSEKLYPISCYGGLKNGPPKSPKFSAALGWRKAWPGLRR